jgi:phosphotriesterase-related protein
VRGAALAGAATGVPVFISCGSDAVAELQLAVGEGIAAERVAIGDLDRREAVSNGWHRKIAQLGAWAVIDHIGSTDPRYVTDAERLALVLELVKEGLANRILLSSSATGVSFGVAGNNVAYSALLTSFVPMLRKAGVANTDIEQMLIGNAAALLCVGSRQQ